MNKGIDVYLKHYDNLLILGELNSVLTDNFLNNFSTVNNLRSPKKEPTCLKNQNNSPCIDLFLTNRPRWFKNKSLVGTGISDFHALVVKVLKMFYKTRKSFNTETVKLYFILVGLEKRKA